MAKVEMDLSEFELLKENKRLLEESLKRERSLQDELAKEQQEKIKALEDAKYKVVSIKKVFKTEMIHSSKPVYLIISEILKDSGIADHLDMNAVRLHIQNYVPANAFDKFFETSSIESEVPGEGVEYIGFDEVKAEVEKNFKAELEEDIKRKLARINELNLKLQELQNDYKTITEECEALRGESSKLSLSNIKISKELSELKDNSKKNEESLKSISRAISEGDPIFGKGKTIEKIRRILYL